MEFHDYIRQAKNNLQQIEDVLEMAREQIEEMEAEYKRMDTKMTNTHIAEYLGCSRTTVWRKLNSGKLKSKKIRDVLEYHKNKH